MAVAGFQRGETREGPADNKINFSADVRIVARIYTIAIARSRPNSTARITGNIVKIIAAGREPEAVTFQSNAQRFSRFEREAGAQVLDVLQRGKIHVTIKLVIGWIQIVEGLVTAVS